MINNQADLEKLRTQIIVASLSHVPFDGWTMKALKRGATDCGLDDASALLAFPVSATDAIEYHSQLADKNMVREAGDLSSLSVRKRVAKAIQCRLEQNIAHREAIRRACSVLALPANAPMAARCRYRTVDTIWYVAGDRSSDWNFYSKRGLLAGIYCATLIYWLDDTSTNTNETWGFLNRRIDNVMQIPMIKQRISSFIGKLPRPPQIMRP